MRGEQVFSTGPFLYVDFIVDGRGQRQGFEATYQFKPITDDADWPSIPPDFGQPPTDPNPPYDFPGQNLIVIILNAYT
jgi:hypothetical protein